MCQHSEPAGLVRPPVPQNLRAEGVHVDSYDAPEEWLDRELIGPVRVFEGRADTSLEARLIFAGEFARSHRPTFAIAILGVRWAIIRYGRLLAVVSRPDAKTLAAAFARALEVENTKRELDEPRTMAEEMLDLQLLEMAHEVREDDSYFNGLVDARRYLRAGAARLSGGILLQLVESELARMMSKIRISQTRPRGEIPPATVESLAAAVFAYDTAVQACAMEAAARVDAFRTAQGEDLDQLYDRMIRLAEALQPRLAIEMTVENPAGDQFRRVIGDVTTLRDRISVDRDPSDPSRLNVTIAAARLPGELCPECGERAEECLCGRDVGGGS